MYVVIDMIQLDWTTPIWNFWCTLNPTMYDIILCTIYVKLARNSFVLQ